MEHQLIQRSELYWARVVVCFPFVDRCNVLILMRVPSDGYTTLQSFRLSATALRCLRFSFDAMYFSFSLSLCFHSSAAHTHNTIHVEIAEVWSFRRYPSLNVSLFGCHSIGVWHSFARPFSFGCNNWPAPFPLFPFASALFVARVTAHATEWQTQLFNVVKCIFILIYYESEMELFHYPCLTFFWHKQLKHGGARFVKVNNVEMHFRMAKKRPKEIGYVCERNKTQRMNSMRMQLVENVL